MRLFLIVYMLALVSPVIAAPKKEAPAAQAARHAYQRGMRHYNLSEFEEALSAFKDAYRLVPDPTLLFNIAQCQRQLKLNSDAIRTYHAFLREAPEVSNRAEVEKLIAGLEHAVAEEEAAQKKPPVEPMQAAALAPSPAPVVALTPPPAETTPVYKKWWVWTLVGVAAAGVAVGLGVGLAPPTVTYPNADTPGGRVRF